MNQLKWYSLDPLDLLLLREAKPFNPGDGSWAKGQFPPLPITVFQALRSALPWNDSSDRTQRNLEFIGPFLLQAEPGQSPQLWLPTPQDLVCVASKAPSSPGLSADDDQDTFHTPSPIWSRTARLQPLDSNHSSWSHLGFPPEVYTSDGLAPLLPPLPIPDEKARTSNNHLIQDRERVSGRPQPWIRADALHHYLQGDVLTHGTLEGEIFQANPWTTQVLSHIKVQAGTRQVEAEAGYFTEVAIRLKPHWKLVAGLSVELEPTVVRLGGEGHRVLVTRLQELPAWEQLLSFQQPATHSTTAYLLTPGLAETEEGSGIYTLFPSDWKPHLRSCAGDRPLLWGGMSVYQKPTDDPMLPHPREVAFLPQRAFVKPGTVYRFRSVPELGKQLLPRQGGHWLKTFQTLNYGTLLWGQS